MSHSTRKAAEEEAGKRRVWCKDCEEYTILGVDDNSFGHAFGTEHRFDVVCSKCGGYSWDEKGPCKFAVKLPTGRFVCDMEGQDICECDSAQKDSCSGWEGEEKISLQSFPVACDCLFCTGRDENGVQICSDPDSIINKLQRSPVPLCPFRTVGAVALCSHYKKGDKKWN